MRLLTIISGVMLIISGLFCFANAGETFLALAFILGLVMILSSIIQIISYWWGRVDRSDNNSWIFAEAIITLIMGVLIQTSLIAADAAIPMVFGMWAMFSGVLRFVVATLINPSKKTSNFLWTMIIGILGIICGIYAFVNPMTGNLPIAVLLGIIFLMQGIGILELGIHMPHEKKDNSKPKARMIKIQIKNPMSKNHKNASQASEKTVPEREELEIGSEVVNTDEITLDDLRPSDEDGEEQETVSEEEAESQTVSNEEETIVSEIVSEESQVPSETVSESEADPEEINLEDIISALSIGDESEKDTDTESESKESDGAEEEVK